MDENIRVIDEDWIEIQVLGKKSIIQRRCPHEGADLSLGYMDGNVLRCPWHNLPVDIEGRTPCKTLKCRRRDEKTT